MQHNTPQTTLTRTPYHALEGVDRPLRIPGWAERRSVYRSAGRTLYLVETTDLAEARSDLRRIARAGWQVDIDRQGTGARIALTRGDLARAA